MPPVAALLRLLYVFVGLGLLTACADLAVSADSAKLKSDDAAPPAVAHIRSIEEFHFPNRGGDLTAIAPGPDGNLWFTDHNLSYIGRITTRGRVTKYALRANAHPFGIAAGSDGNVWFTESGAGRIGRISPRGAIVEYRLPDPDCGPTGIALGPDRAIWFAEYAAGRIGRITPSGVVAEFPLPSHSGAPLGVTVGPDRNIWFAEQAGARVGKMTPSGAVTEYTVSDGVQSIASDGNALWFTEPGADAIGRITTTGLETFYHVTSASFPACFARGRGRDLWFTESLGGRLGTIGATGEIAEFGDGVSGGRPQGITFGADGRVWVVEDQAGAFEDGTIARVTLTP
jgi:virginiamycin B lyase